MEAEREHDEREVRIAIKCHGGDGRFGDGDLIWRPSAADLSEGAHPAHQASDTPKTFATRSRSIDRLPEPDESPGFRIA